MPDGSWFTISKRHRQENIINVKRVFYHLCIVVAVHLHGAKHINAYTMLVCLFIDQLSSFVDFSANLSIDAGESVYTQILNSWVGDARHCQWVYNIHTDCGGGGDRCRMFNQRYNYNIYVRKIKTKRDRYCGASYTTWTVTARCGRYLYTAMYIYIPRARHCKVVVIIYFKTTSQENDSLIMRFVA